MVIVLLTIMMTVSVTIVGHGRVKGTLTRAELVLAKKEAPRRALCHETGGRLVGAEMAGTPSTAKCEVSSIRNPREPARIESVPGAFFVSRRALEK